MHEGAGSDPRVLPPSPRRDSGWGKVTRLGVDHALHDRRPLRPRRQPAVLDAHLQPNLNPSPPETTEPPSPDPSFRRAKAGRRRNSPPRADRRVRAGTVDLTVFPARSRRAWWPGGKGAVMTATLDSVAARKKDK